MTRVLAHRARQAIAVRAGPRSSTSAAALQGCLAHAEHLLGRPNRTPRGRLRLRLALTMRRLTRP
ncbi:hypothetical protein AB0K68_04700 [Streptomyces sp. NPDC050698]